MSSAAVAVVDEAEEISCVIIPVMEDQLLLPNICVAEIVPWRRIKIIEDGPSWCMGYVGWRGQTIPVLHFAGFNDGADRWNVSARCLVIMNRARNSNAPAFYALAAKGLPRMLQLMEDDFKDDGGHLGDADLMRVKVGTEHAIIPDLAYIEGQLCQLQTAPVG